LEGVGEEGEEEGFRGRAEKVGAGVGVGAEVAAAASEAVVSASVESEVRPVQTASMRDLFSGKISK
jgi:hypothetical protein